MNKNLSPAENDACLEILYRGLLQIRMCHGDAARVEAIADALHNLPQLLSVGDTRGWTVDAFRELFLEPLVEQHPDLIRLTEPLDALR